MAMMLGLGSHSRLLAPFSDPLLYTDCGRQLRKVTPYAYGMLNVLSKASWRFHREPPHSILLAAKVPCLRIPKDSLTSSDVTGASPPSQAAAAETSGRWRELQTSPAGTLQGTYPQGPDPETPSCPGCPGLLHASCSNSLHADSSPVLSGYLIM